MYKKEANKKGALQPAPKVLVSCRGLDGENNALVVGYCGNCSYAPPMVMVGIVPTRYSYKMITGEVIHEAAMDFGLGALHQ